MNRPIPLRPSFPAQTEASVPSSHVRNAFAFTEAERWSRLRERVRSSRFVELLGWAPCSPGPLQREYPEEAEDRVAPVGDPIDSARSFERELNRLNAGEPVVEREPAVPVAVAPVAAAPEAAPRIDAPDLTAPPAAVTQPTQPPLTRLPLRTQREAISWTRLLPSPMEPPSQSERIALLRAFGDAGEVLPEAALCKAYHEEAPVARLLALKALSGCEGTGAREIVRDALRRGTDDERTFAVDTLAARGERESLVPALSDRVEAIAARAALAYVGSYVRADYERVLPTLVAGSRLDAILTLLAGVVA